MNFHITQLLESVVDFKFILAWMAIYTSVWVLLGFIILHRISETNQIKFRQFNFLMLQRHLNDPDLNRYNVNLKQIGLYYILLEVPY